MSEPHKHRDAIIAWANGEEIECRMGTSVCNEWMTCSQTTHQFSDLNEYRIKPRIIKREGWVNVYSPDRVVGYATKEDAEMRAGADIRAIIRIEWEQEI